MTNHGFAYRSTRNPQPKLMWLLKINKLVRISVRLSRSTFSCWFFLFCFFFLHQTIWFFLINKKDNNLIIVKIKLANICAGRRSCLGGFGKQVYVTFDCLSRQFVVLCCDWPRIFLQQNDTLKITKIKTKKMHCWCLCHSVCAFC